jgi:hypothetical protein
MAIKSDKMGQSWLLPPAVSDLIRVNSYHGCYNAGKVSETPKGVSDVNSYHSCYSTWHQVQSSEELKVPTHIIVVTQLGIRSRAVKS